VHFFPRIFVFVGLTKFYSVSLCLFFFTLKENGISEDMEEVVYELSDNVTRMLS
jgi:hypothetical protein